MLSEAKDTECSGVSFAWSKHLRLCEQRNRRCFVIKKLSTKYILLKALLQQYWQYSTFRPPQEEIISSVLQKKDTLAILPTGAGKSVCYQLPSLALEGLTLVISPLVSLMQDQVMQLTSREIPAAYIHSGMTAQQIDDVLNKACDNALRLLYVSPERLQSPSFISFSEYLHVSLIAVDEAHCISQWGHDFRPSYRKIGEIRSFFNNAPILALTASANKKVEQDILEQLGMRNAAIFRKSVVRNNLFYTVRYTESKPVVAAELFSHAPASGILYCRSRRRCVESALYLQSRNVESGIYHAGLPKHERDAAQRKWTQSQSQIMCATTAFGMGIDKPDVRLVAHYDAPDSLEAYYQEAGRAGRDGKKADAVLLYNEGDIRRLQESTELHYPPEAYLRQVYQWVGDYLKMPLGAGSDELQSFDALRFIGNYKLETLKALSAIRLLDREGLWIWNENANIYTTVQFTTDRNTLNYLERTEPALHYIASSLLRLYGSIFYYPTAIREFEVSKILRIEKQQLDRGLDRLAALGIINYQPAETGGTLYWVRERLADRNLVLDTARINRLRKAQEERVTQMIAYIREERVCRNIVLARYFGEEDGTACGNCDNCRRNIQKNKEHRPGKEQVLQLLQRKQTISLADIYAHFPEVEREVLTAYIRQLSDERQCRISSGKVIFAG